MKKKPRAWAETVQSKIDLTKSGGLYGLILPIDSTLERMSFVVEKKIVTRLPVLLDLVVVHFQKGKLGPMIGRIRFPSAKQGEVYYTPLKHFLRAGSMVGFKIKRRANGPKAKGEGLAFLQFRFK